MRCWAARSTNCRRRRGACCCLVDEMVRQDCERKKIERQDFRFSRKDVRAFTRWSDSQLKRHLHRLEELEYLVVHQGGRGQSMVYELVFERHEDSARPALPGLIEIGTALWMPVRRKEVWAGRPRGPGQVRPKFGGCPGVVRVGNRQQRRGRKAIFTKIARKTLPGSRSKIRS